jgi:DNA-binding CsgD family transcriptional regulator
VNERIKPRVSARELEVLEAFSDGLTEKQTAEKLNISQHTVHSHRMNMIIKTKSNNIAKLIKYAFTNHWFNP